MYLFIFIQSTSMNLLSNSKIRLLLLTLFWHAMDNKNLTPVNKCGNPKYQMLSLNQACGDEFRNSHTKLILEVGKPI